MSYYLPNPGTPKQIKEFLALEDRPRRRRLSYHAKYGDPAQLYQLLQEWEAQTKKGRWAQKHRKVLGEDLSWVAECWDLRSSQERELLSDLEAADTEVQRVEHLEPVGTTLTGPDDPSGWRTNPEEYAHLTDAAVTEILDLPPVERHEYYAAMASADPSRAPLKVLRMVISWGDRAIEDRWDEKYPDADYAKVIGADLKWLQECYGFEIVSRPGEALAEQEEAEEAPGVIEEWRTPDTTETAVERMRRRAREAADARAEEMVVSREPIGAGYGGGAGVRGDPTEEPFGMVRSNPKGKKVKYATALTLAQEIVTRIRRAKIVRRKADVVVAGSVRRRAKAVNDIDLLLVDTTPSSWGLLEQVPGLTLTMFGPKKAQGTFKVGRRSIRVDFRAVSSDSLGAALEYFTGPKQHNLGMRSKAKRKGMKLNEYGLFDAKTGKLLAAKTEKAIYAALGHRWKPPWERSGRRK
jgi:hypothetical protein